MPDSTTIGDKAVAVFETVGLTDRVRTNLERPGIQVVVRGAASNQTSTAYQDAQARAKLVNAALNEYAGTTPSSGTYVAGIWHQSGPFFLGFDEGWRPQFSANYLVMRQTT